MKYPCLMHDSAHSLRWYVVYSKPSQEERAAIELSSQGYSVYLPKITESRRLRGQWVQQIRPMFPRYLFVQPTHPEQSIAPVKSTRGVSHLVRQGSNLVSCPDALVVAIRNAEAQLVVKNTDAFVGVGETIEIIEGPFQGLISHVVAATEDRVSILLEVLGNLQSLEFPLALCRKV